MSTTISLGLKNLEAKDMPTLPTKLILEAIKDIFSLRNF
jgi:hypothetical protein